MQPRPLTVAWISYFPVEWLDHVPEAVARVPRAHAGSWLRVLLAELERQPGLKIHVIALRKEFESDLTFERNGVTFHLMKVPGGLRAPSLFWLDTWRIKRRLAEIRPDVVHAWGSEKGAALVASRLPYPYLVSIQGLLTWYNELVPLNRYQRFAVLLEKWSLPRAPVVTTESIFAVQYLNRKFPGLPVRQAEHAPDWIFHRLQRCPQTRPFRFIFVAPLSHIKGGDLLLRALDRLKDELAFEMVVIGRPAPGYLERIRAATSAELWTRVQLKDDLPPAAVAEELAKATLMIFPTRADTSPNSVKEAVVAGVPVVASVIGGIPDYVFPGKNGLLFPSENLDKCVQAIRDACAHPLFGRGAVDPETLAQTREYLSPRRMGAAFLEIYNLVRRGEISSGSTR